MKRHALGIGLALFLVTGSLAVAQSSLDALEQELNEAKQQHQDVTTQTLTNFFAQIDAAMASPDAAVALYIQARSAQSNSNPPDVGQSNESSLLASLLACGIPPTPVATEHEEESATEKEARLSIDQANLARLGVALQLHCGLMHYAALFVVKPDQKGLQDEWAAWLQKAAQIYPQLAVPPDAGTQDSKPKPEGGKKKKDAPSRPYDASDLKSKSMRDSIISKSLGFNSWADKEQGGWAVQDLPKLYRTDVLEPLRTTPTTATLTAWDVYIAMANADEKDNDRWNQVDYPPLQFNRACDAYAIAPDTEKLEGLVNLIKANPTYPQVDDWIARVHQMMEDYRTRHGRPAVTTQAPAPTTSTAGTDPNVTVTTQQQGDATIIITHTNSAPVTNAPPAP